MSGLLLSGLLVLLIFTAANPRSYAQQAGNPSAASPQQPPDVIGFLNQSVGWYRHFAVEQQVSTEPADLLFLNDDRQIADQVVRLSFEFARAQIDLAPAEGQAPAQGASPYQSLIDLAKRAEQQVQKSQAELAALRKKLETANGHQRLQLESAIAETQSELQLAQTRHDVMRGMVEFVSGVNASGSSNGLRAQVEELERAVPAAAATPGDKGSAHPNPATAAATAAAPALNTRRNDTSGILALISDLISMNRKMHTLDETIALTDELAQSSKSMRAPQVAGLRQLAQQGDQLANEPPSGDPKVLQAQKQQLDALTTEFKQRSEAVIPLVKQRILLDLYKRSVGSWRASVKNQYTAELKSLVIRLAVLAVMLALVLGVSKLWSHAIFRYIHDARRRYQLLLIRRIVLWCVIGLVIAFAFAAELGSLATFAGLITAGVAVALQNVILSIAGYFFLIGKYGVRVGDRVQISGVSGEVVDIGLVRLHIMELGPGGVDSQPTGRVVVFSNSVVFQPTGGFFKQIPGTSFVWHQITLLLAPETDYREVEDRLVGAVEAVFTDYTEQMERQRKLMEKTLSPVAVNALKPQSRLRLTRDGLEVVIRYPAELDNAATMDDRITRQVLDAIEREPKLRLVGSGTPNIQPVLPDAAGMVKAQ